MKQIKILLVALFCTVSLAVFAQSERLTIPLSNPGSPGSLSLHLVHGSIRVLGDATGEVLIEAHMVALPSQPEPRTDGLRKIPSNSSFDLSADEKNNEVIVRSGTPTQKINLTIHVPKNFSLKVGTVNGGDIVVENVNGNAEISNVNGKITLTNIGGSAVANTVNGGIKANFTSVSNDTPMAFTSLNGNVDVTFPGNTKANLKLESQRGEILSDFEIALSKAAPEVTRSSDGGMQKIKKSGWTLGSINGGGPEVMMKTMNGNVIIRKAK